MIKRIRIWLKDLTLFQQFFTIGFLIITNLFIVFYMLLTQNLNDFMYRQMYEYLHQAQTSYISAYSNGYQNTDSHIEHVFYDFKHDEVVGGSTVEDVVFNIEVDYENREFQDGRLVREDVEVPFSIVPTTKDGVYLISIIKANYIQSYRQALVNNVVHLNIVVLSLLFFCLTIWVISIINPIKQIRKYINGFNRNDTMFLDIKRGDEIGELANSVVLVHDELDKQNRIKQEMLQNISHDLKTPIATIKSYSEAIKDGIYPYETLEKSVDVIIEHAQRLENKVYNLINFNKLGYIASENIEPKNVFMPEVINSVILGARVLKNDIEIRLDVEEVFFKGDLESWRILLENLIDNALRYAKSLITITLKENYLSVYNDGKAIENMNSLFKAYEKGNDGNFGLGLSIVKKVCETYGYIIKVENLDLGVQFTVTKKESKRLQRK